MRDLEVPDLSSERVPLAMSGIVLTSARAEELTTAGDDERLIAVLDSPPAARRQFSPDDELVVFVEVYDTDKAPHQDTVTTRVVDQSGETVVESVDPISGDALHNERSVYDHRVSLRVDDLRPGRYVLKVEVQSQLNRGTSVFREVPFTLVK
jgi:hypothetical protein